MVKLMLMMMMLLFCCFAVWLLGVLLFLFSFYFYLITWNRLRAMYVVRTELNANNERWTLLADCWTTQNSKIHVWSDETWRGNLAKKKHFIATANAECTKRRVLNSSNNNNSSTPHQQHTHKHHRAYGAKHMLLSLFAPNKYYLLFGRARTHHHCVIGNELCILVSNTDSFATLSEKLKRTQSKAMSSCSCFIFD